MHADLKGALAQINRSWRTFEHRDRPMTKSEVRKVLMYGLEKGYKTTAEFTDEEVDQVLGYSNEQKS